MTVYELIPKYILDDVLKNIEDAKTIIAYIKENPDGLVYPDKLLEDASKKIQYNRIECNVQPAGAQ